MNLLVKGILLLLFAPVLHRIYVLLASMQFGKVVYNHAPGPCRTVEGVDQGSEDLQVTSDGKAFITSGMKAYHDMSDPAFKDRKGRIFMFDFNKPNETIKELQIDGDIDLSNWGPHGISIWEDKKGSVTLFVVVHRPSSESIEKFRYQPETETLKHVQTIADSKYMHKLNDVVAVSENSFYFSNYQRYLGLVGELETLAGFRLGNLVFFDGNNYQTVAGDIFLANGVNLSPDGKFLYMMSGDMALTVFQRAADNTLSFLRQIPLHTAVDNIDVDRETGDIWTGSHPIVYKAFLYLHNPFYPAPSQVLRLGMKDGDVTKKTEVYVDDGAILKGSTIAARYKDAFLVGTIFDKLLYCEIKHI